MPKLQFSAPDYYNCELSASAKRIGKSDNRLLSRWLFHWFASASPCPGHHANSIVRIVNPLELILGQTFFSLNWWNRMHWNSGVRWIWNFCVCHENTKLLDKNGICQISSCNWFLLVCRLCRVSKCQRSRSVWRRRLTSGIPADRMRRHTLHRMSSDEWWRG